MAQLDNVPNVQHWQNLVRKAERGFELFKWKDFHILFDPIYYTIRGIDHKGYYRRIFQVPFLMALYGVEETPAGVYDERGKEVLLPRYQVIARQVVDHLMNQNPESVLAFMDSLPTAWELEHDGDIRPLSPPKKKAPAKAKRS